MENCPPSCTHTKLIRINASFGITDHIKRSQWIVGRRHLDPFNNHEGIIREPTQGPVSPGLIGLPPPAALPPAGPLIIGGFVSPAPPPGRAPPPLAPPPTDPIGAGPGFCITGCTATAVPIGEGGSFGCGTGLGAGATGPGSGALN